LIGRPLCLGAFSPYQWNIQALHTVHLHWEAFMTDANRKLTMLTRLGFASRGMLYIVIAMLVLTTGRAEDPAGALQYVSEGGGKVLLLMMTIGLLAYGIWRLCDAALNVERHGTDRSGAVERIGAAGSGIVHLFLAWQAIRLMQGIKAAGGGEAQDSATSVLQVPGGGMLLLLGSLVLLATGAFQLVKAFKGSYLKHLDPQVANQRWAKWSGRSGYAARGLIFLITGVFLARAGFDEQASRAGDMADALTWLNSPWDLAVAFGLLGFGIFSLIEARYRILHDVPVHSIGHEVRSKLH
jgi:hypothetical protein